MWYDWPLCTIVPLKQLTVECSTGLWGTAGGGDGGCVSKLFGMEGSAPATCATEKRQQ